jgi:hypothetical protein
MLENTVLSKLKGAFLSISYAASLDTFKKSGRRNFLKYFKKIYFITRLKQILLIYTTKLVDNENSLTGYVFRRL